MLGNAAARAILSSAKASAQRRTISAVAGPPQNHVSKAVSIFETLSYYKTGLKLFEPYHTKY